MKKVAIVGAGIAGLTTAHRLHHQGHEVEVFEDSGDVGGVIRTERAEGYLVEQGPNTIQVKTHLVDDLIEEAGIADALQEANVKAKRRYVVKNGAPVAIPSSPPAIVRTSLFSTRAKLALLREPFVSPVHAGAEESIADFVLRRLGREWLDYAINPFVAGVFAGDPERLSLRHAFPRMHELEQTYGSLIRGQIALSRERKKLADPTPRGRLVSFRNGLQTLPAALARPLEDRVRLHTRVTKLRQSDGRWTATLKRESEDVEERFDAVVLTVPLYQWHEIDLGFEADLSALSSVNYPPVRVVALGYRREDVAHPLDGFGMLVPAVEEQFRILGCLFSSTLFPGRSPEGHVLLTVFVGGSRRPALAEAPEDEVHGAVERDLRKLLGVKGKPVFRRHVLWPHAIPQYHVGYGRVKALLDRLEEENPGLILAGSYRQGISVSDSIVSGEEAALRIRQRSTA